MNIPTAQEPLRDRIGRALYEEPGLDRDWYQLSEDRREPWRKDADRVIAVVDHDFKTSTDEARGHIRHIASVARAARRDLRVRGPAAVGNLSNVFEEVENSARHALAASLPTTPPSP